ncbi:ABC transporter permease [Luethyella okanaganae]|uniref:ABC transporter permease n=1 Tax=Luethyella okanaganae TaxID=69372 RepID=A0ABW1VGW9_9MICO
MSTVRNTARADAPAETRPAAPGTLATITLVAGREISTRLRSRSFIISTAILMLVVLGSVVVGGLISQNAEAPKVAVVGSAAGVVAGTPGLTAIDAADRDAGERMLRASEVSAVVVSSGAGSDPVGVTVIGLDSAPREVINALSLRPTVEILEPASQDGALIYFVALGFGLVFLMSALTFGQTIALSVVEEKQTRIVEILMSTIPVRTLLAGKVIGNSIMAFGQIVAIGALAVIGMVATGQRVLLGSIGAPIVWFIVFFAIGFVLLAALFAASAALVSRAEDVGAVISPVTMLVMIPYFLVIFFNDNETVLTIMSYVPFSAPVGMPMRVFLGTAQWWEPLLSLAILVATTVIVLGFAARIYSNSLLRTGARVTLTEALKG